MDSLAAPQLGQALASSVPQARQKRRDAAFHAPQLVQSTPTPPTLLGARSVADGLGNDPARWPPEPDRQQPVPGRWAAAQPAGGVMPSTWARSGRPKGSSSTILPSARR